MNVPDHKTEQKLNNTLDSRLDAINHRARNNAMGMMALVASIHEQEREIREGGGAKAIEAQHAKKRLTARERIALLLDPGTELFELGLFAAYGMYEEWGGAPPQASSPASAASPDSCA